MPIHQRVGEFSYHVLTEDGKPYSVHMDQLKPHVVGEPIELFHYQPRYEVEGSGPTEWNVAEILEHRWVDGALQFLTRWEGAEPHSETWEPVGNFIHRYSFKLPAYCQQHNVMVDLTQYLSPIPLAE